MAISLLQTVSVNAADGINIGDYVQMGTYYGVPILWRCVDIDENGPLMLSDKIICIKPFDASGANTSGSHGRGYYHKDTQGYWRQDSGSNYWADSNIRCWLNSLASAGNVDWACGNPPDNSHVWNGYNDYADEAGFLTNFSKEELNAIKQVTQKSLLDGYEYSDSSNTRNPDYHQYDHHIDKIVQNYDTAFSEPVTDKIFLPDAKQINAVYNNSGILGDKYYIGEPTVQCVENSEYQYETEGWFEAGKKWYSWLRTPDACQSGDPVRGVDPHGDVFNLIADDGARGIRPAFYLNLKTVGFKGGQGTVSKPYYIDEKYSEVDVVNIGKYVQMGTYYGEPILWRCVDIDKNGPLMLSDKIICLKAFDASGDNTSGSHSRSYNEGFYRREYGSNYWADSNIRSWLNSTDSEGNVNWACGNPPDDDHVWKGYNDYASEAGFLTNFTRGELYAIKQVTQKSILDDYEYSETANPDHHIYNSDINDVLQNYDTAFSEKVTDMMFLPDVKQINAVYNNSEILGDGYYIGEPTAQCVANSEYTDSSLGNGNKWCSWLRTPGTEGAGTAGRYVDYNGTVISHGYYSTDWIGCNGIRPAFYLNIETASVISGSGTEDDPYVVNAVFANWKQSVINVGEYLQMGTYYGEPILWRCVDIDENGPLMLSDKIICLKVFDASGTNTSGSHGRGYYIYDVQGFFRQKHGSNYWADSNMRCWLNSLSSAGNVNWACGNPPDREHVSYKAYDNEAGFLTNFSKGELNSIKQVTQKSLVDGYEYSDSSNTINPDYYRLEHEIDNVVQNYDTAFSEQVTDIMFLPDVKQINAVYNNRSVLGDDYYLGEPTAQCVANSIYTNISFAAGGKWETWLRSADADYCFNVCFVDYFGWVYSTIADDGSRGVRPAFYLNPETAVFTNGGGTEENPYTVSAETSNWNEGISAEIKEIQEEDESLIVTAEIESFLENAENALCFFAAYDENGKLICVYCKDVPLKVFGRAESLKLIAPLNTASYKLMLWNNDMQTLLQKPISGEIK